jgi:hypothetical protein
VYLSVSVRFSRHSSPFFSAASFSASYPTSLSLYPLFHGDLYIYISNEKSSFTFRGFFFFFFFFFF